MKRSLRLLLIALHFCLLFSSCANIEYESDDRIAFEGYVKRLDGSAVRGIPVYTYVSLNDGAYNSDHDYISYTKTDANGHYLMIFPKPTNHTGISVLINDNVYFDTPLRIDTTLTSFAIDNILPHDLNPLHLNFGNSILYGENEITTLTINFIPQNTPQTTYMASYEAEFPQEHTSYSEPDQENPVNPSPEGLYPYSFYQLDDTTYSRVTRVLANQTVVFKYLDANNEVITLSIPVGTEPVTYTINY